MSLNPKFDAELFQVALKPCTNAPPLLNEQSEDGPKECQSISQLSTSSSIFRIEINIDPSVVS